MPLVEEIYQQAIANDVRLAALDYISMSPDEKAQRLAALIDPQGELSFRMRLAFALGKTGSLEAAKPLVDLIQITLATEVDALSTTSSLSGLLYNIPKSDYPQVKEILNHARLQAPDKNRFDNALAYVVKILDGEVEAPNFSTYTSQ